MRSTPTMAPGWMPLLRPRTMRQMLSATSHRVAMPAWRVCKNDEFCQTGRAGGGSGIREREGEVRTGGPRISRARARCKVKSWAATPMMMMQKAKEKPRSVSLVIQSPRLVSGSRSEGAGAATTGRAALMTATTRLRVCLRKDDRKAVSVLIYLFFLNLKEGEKKKIPTQSAVSISWRAQGVETAEGDRFRLSVLERKE